MLPVLSKVSPQIKKFLADRSGVTAIEYGLIASLMAAALVLAIVALGINLGTTFTGIGTHLTTAT